MSNQQAAGVIRERCAKRHTYEKKTTNRKIIKKHKKKNIKKQKNLFEKRPPCRAAASLNFTIFEISHFIASREAATTTSTNIYK